MSQKNAVRLLTLLFVFSLWSALASDSTQGSLQLAISDTYLNDIEGQILQQVVDELVNTTLPNLQYETDLPWGYKLGIDLVDMMIETVQLNSSYCETTYRNKKNVPQVVFKGKKGFFSFVGHYKFVFPLLGKFEGDVSLHWHDVDFEFSVEVARKGTSIDLILQLASINTGNIHLVLGNTWLDSLIAWIFRIDLWLFNTPFKSEVQSIINNLVEKFEKEIPEKFQLPIGLELDIAVTQDPFLAEMNSVLVIGVSAALSHPNSPNPLVVGNNITYDYSNIQGVRILCHEELLLNVLTTVLASNPVSFTLGDHTIDETLGIPINTGTLSSFIPELRNIKPAKGVSLGGSLDTDGLSVVMSSNGDFIEVGGKFTVAVSVCEDDGSLTYIGNATGQGSAKLSTRAIHKGFLLNMKDIELNQIESQYRSFDAKAVMVFADFAIQIGIDFVNQLLARYPIQDQSVSFGNWIETSVLSPHLKFGDHHTKLDAFIKISKLTNDFKDHRGKIVKVRY